MPLESLRDLLNMIAAVETELLAAGTQTAARQAFKDRVLKSLQGLKSDIATECETNNDVYERAYFS
jgi:hypothetical protein